MTCENCKKLEKELAEKTSQFLICRKRLTELLSLIDNWYKSFNPWIENVSKDIEEDFKV